MGCRDQKEIQQQKPASDGITKITAKKYPAYQHGGKQGKQVDASQSAYAATQYKKDDMLRILRRKLESAHAAYRHLGMRIDNYTSNLVPQAKANASAALRAYQSDRGQFTDLMRARVMELETGLQHLRLQTDWTKAQAELLYFGGEGL